MNGQASLIDRVNTLFADAVKERSSLTDVDWPDRHILSENGKPVPFHMAQEIAYDSPRRTVALIAGTQSGKTVFGPQWLKREIERGGRGDYIAVTSSYDLFKLRMMPAIQEFFVTALGVGRYWGSDRLIELRDKTGSFWATRSTDSMWARILLRSAQAGSGLEASTAKAIWLDEAGQDEFGVSAYRALRRRGHIHRARILITTTLYNLGWLVQQVIKRAQMGGEKRVIRVGQAEIEITDNAGADIVLIQYDSIINPVFSPDEYFEAKGSLPDEDFQMQYRGRVARPRDLIYDILDTNRDTCDPFPIPPHWPRYMGLDFGSVHLAAMKYAEQPKTGVLYAYQEYLEGHKLIAEHVRDLLDNETRVPFTVGGSSSEGQWRDEFSAAGLIVHAPSVTPVWLGINIVYGAHKQHRIVYFNTLEGILDEKGKYRRARNKRTSELTDDIEQKSTFHRIDSERYVISELFSDAVKLDARSKQHASAAPRVIMPDEIFGEL